MKALRKRPVLLFLLLSFCLFLSLKASLATPMAAPKQDALSPSPSGTSDNYIIETISAREGLAQSWITCILKDRLTGLMWFGTLDGLYIYDGYSFHVHKYDRNSSSSLPRDAILSLHQDQNGSIWVGTSGGLARFNRNFANFTSWHYDPLDPSSISNDSITAIHTDSEGNLWLGTRDGLNRFEASQNRFTRFMHASDNLATLSDNHVKTIFQDSDGTLWIGTEDGLNRFSYASASFERNTSEYSRLIADDGKKISYQGLPVSAINDIVEDNDKRLWLATNNGLVEYQRSKNIFLLYKRIPSNTLSQDSLTAIMPGKDGRLRLTSDGNGLIIFDPQNETFTSIQDNAHGINLISSYLSALFEDEREILWLATHGRGVNKIRKNPFSWYGSNSSSSLRLSDNNIKSVYQDKNGIVWVGTQNGLNRIGTDKKILPPLFHKNDDPLSLPHNQINAITQDRFGTLWFGTPSGLAKLNSDGTFNVILHNPLLYSSLTHNNISALYPDPSGKLWVGTAGGGLSLYDPLNQKAIPYRYNLHDPNTLSNNYIQALTIDRHGVLWVGTSDGLNRFDRNREEFVRYKHDYRNPNSLSNSNITAIHEDSRGNLWISTWGGGLNLYDAASDQFTVYQQKDGLGSNILLGMLEEAPGLLWLSSDKGLTRFDTMNKTFRVYNIYDGLQGNEFSLGACARTEDGDFYFGGLNGLNRFKPDVIQESAFVPKIALTKFKVFDREIPLTTDGSNNEKITLSYRDNYFSLEYSALDYMSPEKIKYAYKLEGFDSDWIYADARRFASYTNLDGGSYTFRVKATNSDGLWEGEGIKLQIIIEAPPWKSWWAYCLYFFTLCFAVFALMRYSSTRSAQLVEARAAAEIRKLWQAVEQSEHAILITDAKGVIEYANHNFSHISGFLLAQLKSHHASEIAISQETASSMFEIWQPFWQMLCPPLEQRKELLLQRPDATPYWGLVVVSAIRNPEGETVSYLLAMGDITDLKTVEKQLAATNEELSQTLDELRNTQGELLRQEKMAALGELVAGVAHEINTPVGVGITAVSFLDQQINDFTKLFAGTSLRKSDVQKFIEACQESSDIINLNLTRAAELVKSFKQVAVDQTAEQERVFNLVEYLRSILLSLHPALKKTQLKVEVQCPSDLLLYSYPGVFSQIITNLVNNSLLHAYQPGESGKITIRVTTEGNSLMLSYSDDGCGMKEEILKRIFDPFFTTKRITGTGLGMHIVHNLVVQKLHGRIEAKSEEHNGFTCIIRIPLQLPK